MNLGRGEGTFLKKGFPLPSPNPTPLPPKTFVNGSGNGCGAAADSLLVKVSRFRMKNNRSRSGLFPDGSFPVPREEKTRDGLLPFHDMKKGHN
ncbi:hypothetical protein Bwad002_31530 [Bilophila wadsworthia]